MVEHIMIEFGTSFQILIHWGHFMNGIENIKGTLKHDQ